MNVTHYIIEGHFWEFFVTIAHGILKHVIIISYNDKQSNFLFLNITQK